jgi:hypothetical protein
VNTPAAVGFAMSVFFQLVYQVGVILEEHSHLEIIPSQDLICAQEPNDIPVAPSHVDVESNNERVVSPSEDTILPRPTSVKRRVKVGMRRGPRRADRESIPSLHSEDSEHDDEDDASDKLCSDNDEDGDDYYWDASEDESDFSYSDDEDEDDVKLSCKKSGNKAFDSSSSNGKSDSVSGGSGENSQNSNGQFEAADRLSQQLPEEEMMTMRGGTPGGLDNGSLPLAALGAGAENLTRLAINSEGLEKCRKQVEGLLVAMSPFIRCLQTSSEIKDAFAANAEKIFLEKLCGTLTLLASSDWTRILEEVSLNTELQEDWDALLKDEENDVKKNEDLFEWELPEDRSMLGLPMLKNELGKLKINDEMSENDKVN